MKNITIRPTVPLEDTATIDNHVSANVDTSSTSNSFQSRRNFLSRLGVAGIAATPETSVYTSIREQTRPIFDLNRAVDVQVEYSELDVFKYPGEDNLVVMQYQQNYQSNNLDLLSPREVYWRKFDNRWQIVYQGSRTFSSPSTPYRNN